MSHTYSLITGASGGIGSALAEALAAEGRSLILTGRRQPVLDQLQARLQRPGIEVQTLVADLNQAGAAPLLAELQTRDWPVDLLINNAGLWSCGRFSDLDPARELEIVRVNVAALVELTSGCLPAMRERGQGAIINVASTASFQAVPGLATYAASKAFVLSFSRALAQELRGSGVHVMALCPGPTETGFFEVAKARPRPPIQTPAQVAAQALRGLRQRRGVVVCGGLNRVMATVAPRLPSGLVTRLAGHEVRSWQKLG